MIKRKNVRKQERSFVWPVWNIHANYSLLHTYVFLFQLLKKGKINFMKCSHKLVARRGFTLIELLVTLTIIGLLSSIGYVSYESVKVKARDTKRVSDMKAIQTALELHFENHSSYPSDGTPGSNGQLLGFEETKSLSDVGFSSGVSGTPFMVTVPKNPEPGGTEYVYRSLYMDGRDCHRRDVCETYAVLFTLEGSIGSLQPGPHALTPDGIAGEEGGGGGAGITGAGGLIIGLQTTQELVSRYTLHTAEIVQNIRDNEQVDAVAQVAAPSIAALALANVAVTVHSTASAASLLVYLFTQPALLFRRRRKKAWGIIYDSLSKLPVDLAIIRLYDMNTGHRIKTVATDHDGRFSFLVLQGTYRLEVAKNGYTHPSKYVIDVKEDGQFNNVFSGEEISAPPDGGLLTPHVPIDPVRAEQEKTDRAVIRGNRWRRLQQAVAVISPTLGGLALVLEPNLLTGGLFAAQVLAYMLFKRLAITKESKQWGFVYEKGRGKAVPKAVLRVFALPYHKMVDTQVTDSSGRYHFRVGGGLFYLTASKKGYEKTESEPLDLRDRKEPAIIVTNIPLVRSQQAGGPIKSDRPRKGFIVGPGASIPKKKREEPVEQERKSNGDGGLDNILPPR